MTERQKRYYLKTKGAYYRITVGFDTEADAEIIRYLKNEARPNASAWIRQATIDRYENHKKEETTE